jgi:hypothetical protein
MSRLMGKAANGEPLDTPLCGEALWKTLWKFTPWYQILLSANINLGCRDDVEFWIKNLATHCREDG